ncbi:MAG: hypothetical protein DCC49_11170 [Acidobacteria bacterium]|nr:MAG: hypothetical protein DCC49_11170 [Acidobacteriota bacterium]
MPAGSSSDPAGALTDTGFWHEYWGSVSLPARLDLTDPGTRSLASAIDLLLMSRRRDTSRDAAPRALIEIGCAPGAWLAHFARRGFEVAGIDSSPRGVALTRQNLEMQNISAEILEADALDLDLDGLAHAFDVAISIGVVEHFDNPLPIFASHAQLVRSGGTVIIAVPNLRGFNGWLQNRLDPDWLALHNLETLSPPRLEAIGRDAGLECRSLEYAGGFNPQLFEWKERSYLGFATTRMGAAIRRMRRADHWNSKWFSSMIVAEFVSTRQRA